MSWYASYEEDAKFRSMLLARHDEISCLVDEEEKEMMDIFYLWKDIKDFMSVDESRHRLRWD